MFCERIREKYPQCEVIAGVATGAIAHGMLVADRLNLPFIYVRSAAKQHGLSNRIEGHYDKGSKVVVIEDLISTGMSSLAAVEALREAKCNVLGLMAIFTYQFPKARQNFESVQCEWETLSNYSELIELAASEGMVTPDSMQLLTQWRKNPETWGKK